LLANNKRTHAIDRSIDGLKKILQRFWEEKKSLRAEEEEDEEEEEKEVRLLRDLTRHSFVLLERKKERKALTR
jgi:peptidoglycan hydrolase CwlO-like protein